MRGRVKNSLVVVSKWVPTSELASPLFHSLDHRRFVENSIIMIAYDVNDAPRQQLFPVERAYRNSLTLLFLRVLNVRRFETDFISILYKIFLVLKNYKNCIRNFKKK